MPDDQSRPDVIAAIAEHVSLREQMLFQMGRANRLATFAIGGAAAILTFIASGMPTPNVQALGNLLVALGLAAVTLAYVGVIGEETQLAVYLRAQGRFVRDRVGSLPEFTYPQLSTLRTPPVLAWEDMMSLRLHGPWWLSLTTSLAALELGATALFGLVLVVVTLVTGQVTAGDPAVVGLFAIDVVAIMVVFVAIMGLLRMQANLATA